MNIKQIEKNYRINTLRNIKDLIYDYAEIVEPNHTQDEFLRQYTTYKYADETEKTRMVQGMINTVTNP